MAEFERTEEETIQAIKDWWKENGRAVIAGLLLGIGGLVGVRYWTTMQETNRQQASQLYQDVELALQSGNREQASTQTDTLIKEYDGTVYAPLAALAVAKAEIEAGQLQQAEARLRWALEHSDSEEYQHLARQRLARLLLAQNKADAAAALLVDIKPGGYQSIYAELRGDISLAQDKPDAARGHYQTALMEANTPLRRQLLEMKLAELAKAPPAEIDEAQP
ncbi:MAG: tetratricopeptide repeat protein [Thiohalophilus sp.]|jgi:predicted negative regulator of RcsB-dependent stress response